MPVSLPSTRPFVYGREVSIDRLVNARAQFNRVAYTVDKCDKVSPGRIYCTHEQLTARTDKTVDSFCCGVEEVEKCLQACIDLLAWVPCR